MYRAWSVTALAAATIAVASNVLGQDQTVGVVVRVHTVGHMPGDVLHNAEERATRIFAAIGVPLRWANDRCDCRRLERAHVRHIDLIVLSGEHDERFAVASHMSPE